MFISTWIKETGSPRVGSELRRGPEAQLYGVTSSPGKFRIVSKVEGLSLDEPEGLLHAMVREFGGDPAATDATRVLGLPGFANKKYGTSFYVEARSPRSALR